MFIETVKGVETIKACGAEGKVCDNSKKYLSVYWMRQCILRKWKALLR